MKNQINKGKIRLILYAIFVGGFAIAGLVFFGISQYQKAKYEASNVALTGAQSTLTLLEKEEQTELVKDYIKYEKDIVNFMSGVNEANYKAYSDYALPAYALTTLALVSFGLCLKFEDLAKAKEDKD